ncbi:MAG: hypothetical protein HRT87_12750, partial [Legionellales bacterium]|nr:hypothetical protein [Legionellales bacterium]
MVEYNINKALDTIEDCFDLDINEKKYLIDKFCDSLAIGTISNTVRERMLEVVTEQEKFVFKNYAATIHLYNSLRLDERKLTLAKTTEM